MIQRFIQDDDKQVFFQFSSMLIFIIALRKWRGKKTYMLRSDNEDYNVFSVDKTF